MPALEKVLRGALQYARSGKQAMREQMNAAAGPSALFFCCMDQRLQPTKFTHTHDRSTLFMIRNPGNTIPPACPECPTTEAAALELACVHCAIPHVIVCGHSDCKAVDALLKGASNSLADSSPLSACLEKFGASSLEKFARWNASPGQAVSFAPSIGRQSFSALFDADCSAADRLSQVHTLQQLENVCTHAALAPLLDTPRLSLHAMWYCVTTGQVFFFDKDNRQFALLTEQLVERLLTNSADV